MLKYFYAMLVNKNSFNFSETSFSNADELPGENDIEVFIRRTGNHFKITSKGKFKQQISNLSVKVKLDTISMPNFDYALFTTAASDNSITLTGSSTINGDVGTNSESLSSINLNGGTAINGDLWLNSEPPQPPGDYNEEPRHPEWSNESNYTSGDKVYYDGLHYEAKGSTNGVPGEDNAWNLIIPEGEIWKWFDSHDYSKGDKVWLDGDIYIAQNNGANNGPPPGNEWEREVSNINGNIEYLTSPIDYPKPEMPEFPSPPDRENISIQGNSSGEITEDGNYDTISLKSGTELTIDRNGGDRVIRVKNFDITNGHIKFANPSDDGVLKIYIEDDFTFGADSSINKPLFGEESIPENVEIYYAGSDTPKLGGNVTINGSLFIDKADFDFGGSNSTFGYIFSNGDNITVRGGSSVSTLYAPNTNIEMKGLGSSNSILKGSVIAKEFSASGAAEINYVEPDLDKMPDDFLESIGGGSDGEADDKPEIMKWSRN